MSNNTQNAVTSQEPLLTPDDSRYVMFPIQHNDIWEMYKKSIDSFWHTGEVSLAQDMNDWIKLNEDERNFIKMILDLNALLGRTNDYQYMEMTGRTRSINRGSWSLEALQEALGDPASHHAKIFQRLSRSLQLRAKHPAFLPASEQRFIAGSNDYLMFLRHDAHQRLLIVASFVSHAQTIDWPDAVAVEGAEAVDVLSGEGIDANTAISLGGFQVMWLELP